MKRAGQLLLSLTAAAMASALARADDLAMSGNPYSSISERNIFALVPIPTNPPVAEGPPVDPPPKITPNGIENIFGTMEVLFKVAHKPEPGQPASEDSMVLSVGERDDDIEVTKIDDQAGIITFINHGVVQELPLADAPKLNAPAGGGGPTMGGIPIPGRPPGGGGIGLGGRGGLGVPSSNGGGAGSILSSAPPSPTGYGVAATGNSPANSEGQIEDQVLSAAQKLAQMELNRIDTQPLVDQGKMPPLPPTLLTPPDATGVGGVPLVRRALPPVPPDPNQ